MRSFLMAVVLTSTILVPGLSQAGWVLEASVGKGGKVSPSPSTQEQTTIMVAPGWSTPVVSILRLQLGVLANLADKSGTKTNLELRPMIAIVPPVLPIYGRAIFAVTNLAGRDGYKREFAYGAAGGVRFGLGPVGVFAEAGVLPRSRADKINWVIEGRAGAYLEF